MTNLPNNADSMQLEVYELADAVLSGSLTAEQTARLNALVCNNPEARRHYVHFMHHTATLRDWAAENEERGEANDECRMMNDELPGAVVHGLPMTDDRSFVPPVHCSTFSIQHPLPSPLSTLHSFVGSVLFSYLVAAMIVGVGMLIGWAWKLPGPVEVVRQSVPVPSPLSPLRSIVGRITGMVDCQWEKEGFGIRDWGLENPKSKIQNPKSLVVLGDRFALSSGLMEITYDSGAKVILQGPVTYEVKSRDSGYLSIGKLTARVEKRTNLPSTFGRGAGGEGDANADSPLSTLHSPLFSVRTPTATVTDLGTEFGVEVDKQGATTSHVFRGSVEVKTIPFNGESETIARVLHENESVVVKKAGGSLENGSRVTVLSPSAKPVEFVRTLPKTMLKTFDLVDVVAGGDGFSGRRNRGIDPTTGQIATVGSKEVFVISDGRYHQVEGMPFVDGVFIPKGSAGQVQLDSAGHMFGDFLISSDRTSVHVWAGGPIPTPTDLNYPLTIPTDLSGIDYATPGHGLLFLHANKGITFDLDAIRRANPDAWLVRFCSVAGNTGTASEQGTAYADLWVFVDGQVRFRRREITRDSGAFSIAVGIKNEDRFLTLVATDGANDILCDWIFFGDPRLELLSTTTTPRKTK